jgi:hypothetical protein
MGYCTFWHLFKIDQFSELPRITLALFVTIGVLYDPERIDAESRRVLFVEPRGLSEYLAEAEIRRWEPMPKYWRWCHR